jgi:L-threonine kinase
MEKVAPPPLACIGRAHGGVRAIESGRPVRFGQSFGSFGELLQGRSHARGRDFLFTNPVDRFSRAWFIPDQETDELLVYPSHKSKAYKAVTLALAVLGVGPGGTLVIESTIPEGKGISSSSADIVAAIRAVQAAYPASSLGPDRIAEIACQVEPTDGVMFNGPVAFEHRTGRALHLFEPLPRVAIIGVDEGGIVDTEAYNRGLVYAETEMRDYDRLYELMVTALRRSDMAAAAEIATQSAVMNQVRNSKAMLEECRQIAAAHGSLGIVTAHSGTCTGLIFPLSRMDGFQDALRDVSSLTDDFFVVQSIASDFDPAYGEVARVAQGAQA